MYWAGPLFYGMLAGFMMSILLGVIFFMLIQAGIQHGTRKGVIIASGVISGDIIFVSLAIGFTSGISLFLKQHEQSIAFIGGSLLLLMGVSMWFKKRKTTQTPDVTGLKSARDFFVKPFIINLLNPANAAWWLGLYSMPPAASYETAQKITFAAGAITTVFATEVGVAAGASKLKKYIRENWLKKVDKVVGLVMFLIGIKLIINQFIK